MGHNLKSLIVLLFILGLIPVLHLNCYAQSGKTGAKMGSIEQKNDADVAGDGAAVSEEDVNLEDAEVDFEDYPETIEEKSVKDDDKKGKTSKNIAVKKEKAPVDKETLLDRETKRHENQMKQIKLMRKRANEMLRKSETMETKELQKHDENVEEIKNN